MPSSSILPSKGIPSAPNPTSSMNSGSFERSATDFTDTKIVSHTTTESVKLKPSSVGLNENSQKSRIVYETSTEHTENDISRTSTAAQETPATKTQLSITDALSFSIPTSGVASMKSGVKEMTYQSATDGEHPSTTIKNAITGFSGDVKTSERTDNISNSMNYGKDSKTVRSNSATNDNTATTSSSSWFASYTVSSTDSNTDINTGSNSDTGSGFNTDIVNESSDSSNTGSNTSVDTTSEESAIQDSMTTNFPEHNPTLSASQIWSPSLSGIFTSSASILSHNPGPSISAMSGSGSSNKQISLSTFMLGLLLAVLV